MRFPQRGCLHYLSDARYPDADKIVMDNLNTHLFSSLRAVFDFMER